MIGERARALWAAATWWNRRRVAVAGAAIVGASNAAISYDALRAAAAAAGAPAAVTWLFPAAADGIVGVLTPAALELEEAPWHARLKVWSMLWAAILVSVVGNASRAAVVWAGHLSISGAVVPVPSWQAVWLALPPLGYAGSLHVLVLMHRYPIGWRKRAPAATKERAPRPTKTSQPGARSTNTKARVRKLVERALPGRPTAPELAAAVGRSPGHVRRVRGQIEHEREEAAPA